jgi:hypothetical protein
MGKRHGAPGIRRFCHEQVIISDRFSFLSLKREPTWFPYTAQTERVLTRLLGALFSTGLGAKLRALLGK